MLELSQLLEVQRIFDRKIGWNRYEKCETSEEIQHFFQHFILVMVDELGEISRVRKRFLRDKQPLDIPTLKKELVDIFIFVMQGSMALNMNLEEEYMRKMRPIKEETITKHN